MTKLQKIAAFFSLVGIVFSTKVFAVPLVSVESDVVLETNKCLKPEQQACYHINIRTLKTNLDWLNAYFEENVRGLLKSDNFMIMPEKHKEEIRYQDLSLEQLKQNYIKDVELMFHDEFAPIGYEHLYIPWFFAQNGRLAMFTADSFLFAGGAHGYGSTSYINFDLVEHKQLTVDDLLLPQQKKALLAKLEQAYERYLSKEHLDLNNDEMEEYSVELTNNFTFTADHIVFSYPPYVLGPYAYGTITLAIPYSELVGIFKPAYLFNTPKVTVNYL